MTAKRLHPRVQIVWIIRAVLLAAVVTALATVPYVLLGVPRWVPAVVGGVVLVAGVGHALLRYRRWSYEIQDDSLYLERGVVTEVRTVAPFVRVQHVDSRRGPVERVFGLASCVVYTAGSRGADVRIPGLTPDQADDLRKDLKRLAIRAEGEDAV